MTTVATRNLKKSPFTPGPWKVSENKRERTIQIDTADGKGTVVQPDSISWLPDARLIAAAPEMLALIQHAATYGANLQDVHPQEIVNALALIAADARALLARVEGK